jgi:hypothetical protein
MTEEASANIMKARLTTPRPELCRNWDWAAITAREGIPDKGGRFCKVWSFLGLLVSWAESLFGSEHICAIHQNGQIMAQSCGKGILILEEA